jgi:hypothetical protein
MCEVPATFSPVFARPPSPEARRCQAGFRRLQAAAGNAALKYGMVLKKRHLVRFF